MNSRQWAAFLFLSLIWGSSFMWIKIAVSEVHPFAVVSFRLLFGILILIPFFLKEGSGFPKSLSLWSVLAIQGIISAALPWFLITWSEIYIDSSIATILNSTVPVFTIILAHFFIKDERMTWKSVLGLLVCTAGVVLLVADRFDLSHGESNDGYFLLGVIAMLAATFSYGAANIYAKLKLKGQPLFFQSLFTMVCADAVMWALVPVMKVEPLIPSSWLAWVAIIWLGILGAGISYYLFYYLLHSLGATRTSLVTYTIPIVGIILGVLVMHEPLTAWMIAGAGLIVIGVRLVSVSQRKVASEGTSTN